MGLGFRLQEGPFGGGRFDVMGGLETLLTGMMRQDVEVLDYN